MRTRPPAAAALALAVLAAGACARARPTLSVEPNATFAVHPADEAFVVDRLREGGTGTLDPPGWLSSPDAPTFVLRSGGGVRAALWLVGRSRVLVRDDPSSRAPRVAEVLVDWDDGAVRLQLWTRDGSTLWTETFRREDEALLTRAGAGGGVRGTYRATVRDGAGAAVGWMRAQIAPERRAYDAVFPARVEDGLAAAASIALDAEIGWLEEHASGTRGSEEEQRSEHEADRQRR